MKHLTKNNFIQFLMVGETEEHYKSAFQIVESESLPLVIENEGNPRKAFYRLRQFLRKAGPHVIIINADLPWEVYKDFFQKLEQFILPKNPNLLLFLSTIQKFPDASLQEKFPLISGFIKAPFQRHSIELIAANLLLQMQTT